MDPPPFLLTSLDHREQSDETIDSRIVDAKLRQADVLIAQGSKIPDVVRMIGVTQVTYYRWRREFGGLQLHQVKRMKELEVENQRLRGGVRLDARQADPGGGCKGKLLSPSRRRHCIDHVRDTLNISERRACAVLGQHRSTQRKVPTGREDEERLTADTIELARQYGRYGYRKIAALLRHAGWIVNDKRISQSAASSLT
jgi:putative transposase